MLWFLATHMADVSPTTHPLTYASKIGLVKSNEALHAPDDDGWMVDGRTKNLSPGARQIAQDIHLFKSSGLCDEGLIRAQLPSGIDDVAQYFVRHCLLHKFNPCLLFDTSWYQASYPDVWKQCAVVHYIKYGAAENRDPGPDFSTIFYRAQVDLPGDVNPLAHYLASGGTTPVGRTSDGSVPTPSMGLLPPIQYRNKDRHQTIAFAVEADRLLDKPSSGDQRPTVNEYMKKIGLKELGLDGTKLQQIDPWRILALLSVAPVREIYRQNQFSPSQILGRYHEQRLAVGAKFELRSRDAGRTTGPVRISVLMPTYKSPPIYLERAILSLLNQTYANWQLCIFDDASPTEDVRTILRYYGALDKRIKFSFGKKNGGIAAASNAGLALCDGDYIGLLDHDDMLAADAIETVATAISATRADVYYSDECKIDQDDIVCEFFSKPDWSPLLLLNYMYVGHFTVYRSELIKRLKFRSKFDFSQDYDLVLRATGGDGVKVEHIEACLYGWRMISGSAAQGDKPEARHSNIAALQSDLDRRGWSAIAEPEIFANAVKFTQAPTEKISIIVPSDNVDNICETIASVHRQTDYANYELLVVTRSDIARDSRSRLAKTAKSQPPVKFVEYNEPYNFSDKCNVGAREATGAFLIFFNDDVRATDPRWLHHILDFLALDGVGAVGPKLLYENGSVQHGGMVTGVRRFVGTAFHTFKAESSDYFNFLQLVREVSLICGACLAIKADLFARLEGFDAVNTPIMHSDVDLCLRVWEAGFSCVYTPYACLTHIGHLSIGAEPKPIKRRKDKADIFILKRFGPALARDPYFTKSMRDMLYIDSQEPFDYYPSAGGKALAYAGDTGRDAILFSHDLSASGAPKIVFDVACALQRRGYHVVVMSREDGPFRDRLVAAGVDVIIDPLVLDAHPYLIEFAKNFDVVIGNTILTWRLAKALSEHTRVIVYAHETGLVDHLAAHYADFATSLGSAHVVLAGSDLSVKALERHGVSATRLEYGVDTPPVAEVRPTAGRAPAVTRICLIGTIEPRKGQDLAVLAVKELPDDLRRKLRLEIIGRVNDAPFEEAVRELAADIPEISIEGPVDLETYHRRIAACDVVLCPSRDDTLPIVSLDALALGKTLIVSMTTGTSAYVENGISGIVLQDNGPPEIADAIASVMDPLRRRRIGAAARRAYERNFSRDSFETRLFAIVEADTLEAPRDHVPVATAAVR